MREKERKNERKKERKREREGEMQGHDRRKLRSQTSDNMDR